MEHSDKSEGEAKRIATDSEKRESDDEHIEGEIARREFAVTEREQNADAALVDKANALDDEVTRQHRANQAESERLGKLAVQLAADKQALAEKKGELIRREQAVIAAEQAR